MANNTALTELQMAYGAAVCLYGSRVAFEAGAEAIAFATRNMDAKGNALLEFAQDIDIRRHPEQKDALAQAYEIALNPHDAESRLHRMHMLRAASCLYLPK